MIITEEHKKIYNCFLKHYRNGKPFQKRKEFSDLSSEKLLQICKIARLLQKYKNIDWDDFFGSYSYLYPDENCPNLDFFCSPKAIRVYKNAIHKKNLESPEKQIENIKKSLRFIAHFCIKEKIPLMSYIKHKKGLINSWLIHLQNNDINLLSLMELGDIMSCVSDLKNDEKFLFLNCNIDKIGHYKIRYSNDLRLKAFLKEATKKIDIFVEKNLKNSNYSDTINKYEI